MTYDEIMQRINESAKKRGVTPEKIAKDSGITAQRLNAILAGVGTRLYTLLDMIDSAGLELTLNGKPMPVHQDLLIYIEETLYRSGATSHSLAKKTGIHPDTAMRFFRGGNCSASTFYIICEGMGVEVRVI